MVAEPATGRRTSDHAAPQPGLLNLSANFIDFATDRNAIAPGHPIDQEAAGELLLVSASHRNAYRCLPAPLLLDAARSQLSLHPGQQLPDVRQTLVRALGESAVLIAALLSTDLGRHSTAVPYLDLSQRAARDEHNHDLLAVVLACRAFLASFRGDSPRLAADLADGAVSAAREGATPKTLAWVSAVSSEHYASFGDVPGSQRRLDGARRALAPAGNDASWSGLGVFDERKIRAYEGGNLTRLGLYDEAIAVLDDALESLGPNMPRHRCAALTDRAGAHHNAGDVDAACADASEALAIAVGVGHRHTVRRITRLARRTLTSQAAGARRLWIDVLAAMPADDSAGIGQDDERGF